MRKKYALEISSVEKTEVESLDEGDEPSVKPHPPIWHRKCSRCKTIFNVLKVKCPNCGKQKHASRNYRP